MSLIQGCQMILPVVHLAFEGETLATLFCAGVDFGDQPEYAALADIDS